MANGHAWVTRAISNTENYRPLTNDLAADNPERAIESDDRNQAGEPLDASFFPKRLWPSQDVPSRKQPLGNFFFASSVWVASERVAQTFSRFDLGEGNLYPVALLRHAGDTPFGTTYFSLNFGNRKQALLPDVSAGLRKTFNDDYRLKGVVNDDDIKLQWSALVGADLWIDPLVHGAFFVSDRLHSALSETGTWEDFNAFKRCVVIEGD